ncbi:MAG: dihydrodipicolinate synthase family protein [Acidobacteria bacterium]|nr:dihydrodipicolinate synthase family protein [Acidobacteriota bacterium]
MTPEDETTRPAPERTRLAARDLRGVMLPFPTPFDARGELDPAALRTNIARWNETGVTGYVALGSTGERVHLDDAEVLRVVATARACVPDTLALVVGVGQHSTRASVREARRAADAGADALLVITPHFYRGAMTGDVLAAHFEAVADSSPVPVVVYSIPQNTGVTLAPEVVGRLSRHENIVGLKESSGDVVAFVEMLRAAGADADFSMLTGHGSALHAALAAGGRGAILAVACAVPRFCVALCRAFEAGDAEGARRMQRELIPLARAVTTRFGVGGLKVALDSLGYAGGAAVRAPLRTPGEEARREIGELLAGFAAGEGASPPVGGAHAGAAAGEVGGEGPTAAGRGLTS